MDYWAGQIDQVTADLKLWSFLWWKLLTGLLLPTWFHKNICTAYRWNRKVTLLNLSEINQLFEGKKTQTNGQTGITIQLVFILWNYASFFGSNKKGSQGILNCGGIWLVGFGLGFVCKFFHLKNCSPQPGILSGKSGELLPWTTQHLST